MARTHLTLAALVSSAMAGFNPTSSRNYLCEIHDDVDGAVIVDENNNVVVVEVPRTVAANEELRAEARSLEALTAGVRSFLPFSVPEKIQQAQLGEVLALITSYVPGIPLTTAMLRGQFALAAHIGAAMGAIHDIPASVIADASRPTRSALDARFHVRDVVARARATNMLPAPLALRWEKAIDNDALWEFEPTVVHGSLTLDALLVRGDDVAGIIGWHALRIDDPARDLNWLVNAGAPERDEVLRHYSTARRSRLDPSLMQRANLYNEIDVARWLLHGIERKNRAIVDDAVDMLDHLVGLVANDAGDALTDTAAPVLNVSQVRELLEEIPGYRPTGTSSE